MKKLLVTGSSGSVSYTHLVALKEKHVWSLKYNTSINPWNHIRPRILYLVYKLIKKFPIIRKWYKNNEQQYLLSQEAEILIRTLNPQFLVSTYPVSLSEATVSYTHLDVYKRQFYKVCWRHSGIC